MSSIMNDLAGLWIAFKLFNFDLLKQRPRPPNPRSPCCELLSNYLILTYWNSTQCAYKTASELWIAFKLFNFDLLKQRTAPCRGWPCSCELLSNYLILTYWNSFMQSLAIPLRRCELLSNYLILTYWNSALPYTLALSQLWIAFKLFNFDLLKQRPLVSPHVPPGCELLSNYLILTYWNSLLLSPDNPLKVVNCFQTI